LPPLCLPDIILLTLYNLGLFQLKSLPATLNKLASLHTLNLRYNKLNDLKGALKGATTITNLDMRNNNIIKLPPEIGG
jgi:Leucine-rich repeat (LRR) protein